MSWTKDPGIIGNAICTQFKNTVNNMLYPITAYSTSPFINDNTTLTQYITYNSFNTITVSSFPYDASSLLNATSSSLLTVSYNALDPIVATINTNTLTLKTAGVVNIQITQNGNAQYDSANPITSQLTIVYNYQISSPNTYYVSPFIISLNSSYQYLTNFIVNIQDIRYTKNSSIAYGYSTGFRGSILLGEITASDYNNNQITDFGVSPITIYWTLPNANINNILKIYKRTGTTLLNNQTGYPSQLTYNSLASNWNSVMTNLSEIVIIDQTPPSGTAGGDPYIMSIDRVKTLLPNNWNEVVLLNCNNVKVIAKCGFIDSTAINRLHYINKAKNESMKINPNNHKWVVDITYIKNIEFIDIRNNKLIIDTVNGNIVQDNSSFIYEYFKNDINEPGLYSMTHGGFYPAINLIKYVIYFDEGYIIIIIDNYWDDINYIELFLNNSNHTYFGELIEHSEKNLIS